MPVSCIYSIGDMETNDNKDSQERGKKDAEKDL
jgi:hypothetical protein